MLLGRNDIDAALTWAERLIHFAESDGRIGQVIELLILQACAFQANDDGYRALDTLRRVLSLAEPERYVRSFVNQGEPMAQLLRQAKSQGIAPQYVARLLSEFGDEASDKPRTAQPLIEPLTVHELKLLRLIAAGITNREAAAEMYVSVNTVKWHLKNIYQKLDVHSRVEAVTRAQELGLL